MLAILTVIAVALSFCLGYILGIVRERSRWMRKHF